MSIWTSTGGDTPNTQSKVGAWPPANQGKGFTVVGTIVEIRNHTVQDSSNKYHRYVALVLDVEYARNRTYAADGTEVEVCLRCEPNEMLILPQKFTGGDRAANKGYLNKFGNNKHTRTTYRNPYRTHHTTTHHTRHTRKHTIDTLFPHPFSHPCFISSLCLSSRSLFHTGTDHKDEVDPEEISTDQLAAQLGGGKALPSGFYDQQQQQLHPHVKNRFEFWGAAAIAKSSDFKKGKKKQIKQGRKGGRMEERMAR